ncbi:M23 family metallopeptidase [Glaciecola sp. MH2013]|uniref:M23 family metallopeptidase n=1 Tax=Glaciecola sp. MH2013 TaxID=2785524 RepID=UPI00189D994E|nr:M23 family metallopeptidase [Glaciecola sp. MH2013]MBF7072714.1 M23 family metallopeptidase [Glaciecola sp. MH2013]
MRNTLNFPSIVACIFTLIVITKSTGLIAGNLPSLALNASTNIEQQGSDLLLKGQFTQGALLRGQLPPRSKVWLNGKSIATHPNGSFVLGFGRDAALSHQLEWQKHDQSVKHTQDILLEKREYSIQRIEGVASKYVSPPESVQARIKADNQKIAAARRVNSLLTGYLESFIMPAKGPISGVYGSQRVFNGVPKRPHFGLDIAGPVGTEIIAPASGKVSLVHSDMYYSGGTLIIDHGMGISSTFIHLSRITVKEGDVIHQGDKIAEMGATGRVTGPHLDWRINWYRERLDPALLLENGLSK